MACLHLLEYYFCKFQLFELYLLVEPNMWPVTFSYTVSNNVCLCSSLATSSAVFMSSTHVKSWMSCNTSPWLYLDLCICLAAFALHLWECLPVRVSAPAIACLLSSLLSHSCIILWLSHQIWRIGPAKLLSADSSLYATESTSIPVRAQICRCVN